jgi:signal transduction histidine kinase
MQQRADEHNLRQLLALQDRERHLLACEIHDGFVQEVVAAQIAIDALLEDLLRTDPEAIEPLLRIRARVRKAIDEARSVVADLRPPNADADDEALLADLIRDLVEQTRAQRQLDVTLDHNLGSMKLDPVLQSTVLRVVQEALNNVARHARARQATVECLLQHGTLRLVISDSGVGFDPKRVPASAASAIGLGCSAARPSSAAIRGTERRSPSRYHCPPRRPTPEIAGRTVPPHPPLQESLPAGGVRPGGQTVSRLAS